MTLPNPLNTKQNYRPAIGQANTTGSNVSGDVKNYIVTQRTPCSKHHPGQSVPEPASIHKRKTTQPNPASQARSGATGMAPAHSSFTQPSCHSSAAAPSFPKFRDTSLPNELVKFIMDLTHSTNYIYHDLIALKLHDLDVSPYGLDILCTKKSANTLKKNLEDKCNSLKADLDKPSYSISEETKIPGIAELDIPEQIKLIIINERTPEKKLAVQLNLISDFMAASIRHMPSSHSSSGYIHIEALDYKVESLTTINSSFINKFLKKNYFKNIPAPIYRSILFNRELSDDNKHNALLIRALIALHETKKLSAVIGNKRGDTRIKTDNVDYARHLKKLEDSASVFSRALKGHAYIKEFTKAVQDRIHTVNSEKRDFVNSLLKNIQPSSLNPMANPFTPVSERHQDNSAKTLSSTADHGIAIKDNNAKDRQQINAFSEHRGTGLARKSDLTRNRSSHSKNVITTEGDTPPDSEPFPFLQHTPAPEPEMADRNKALPLASNAACAETPHQAPRNQSQLPEHNEPGAKLTLQTNHDNTNSAKCSFSVQQVLQLEQTRTDTRKTSYALKLLYLNCFDFHKKFSLSDGFDENGKKIKVSRQQQKKYFRKRLGKENSCNVGALLTRMKKLPSSEIILAPPKTIADVIPRARKLSETAGLLETEKFLERTHLINSLSAYLALYNYNYGDKVVSEMKEKFKSKGARKNIERLGKDSPFNLEVVIMYYYPFFKSIIHTIHAPFVRPAETIYCRPDLSNKPLTQHGSKIYEMNEQEQIFSETNDSQLTYTPETIFELSKCLSKKLKQLVDENTPATPPDTFSKQCIQWHIQLTCDLVYKMIKMGDQENTTKSQEALTLSMRGLLGTIEIISHHCSEFPHEFIMLAESLCLLLQSAPLQSVLSLQETEVPDDIKKLFYHTVERLENTILIILETSLQRPELLSSTLCLLETISDQKMFSTAQANSDIDMCQTNPTQEGSITPTDVIPKDVTIGSRGEEQTRINKPRIVQLAEITANISNSLLQILTSHNLEETENYSIFLDKLNIYCRPALHNAYTNVIQKINPDHIDSMMLRDSINKLSTECEMRIEKKEEQYQEYLKTLKNEKECNKKALREYFKRKQQLDQKHVERTKKEKQLLNTVSRANPIPSEAKEPASELEKLIKETEEKLNELITEFKLGEHYEGTLKSIDEIFPGIKKSPVLQVWVYGDLAYNLCFTRLHDFNGALSFVENFEKMKSFCTAALEEVTKQPRGRRYDSTWLFNRDKSQPICVKSINFYTTNFSDPAKVEALIKRASHSVSLYETALERARNASHQLTQAMMVGSGASGNAVHTEQMNNLQKRVDFIIDEIGLVQMYLQGLQPVPDMSDLLKTRKELFKKIKTYGSNATGEPIGKSEDNQEVKRTNEIYQTLYAKSENAWKIDSSICEVRECAEQRIKSIIEEFRELAEQLASNSPHSPHSPTDQHETDSSL